MKKIILVLLIGLLPLMGFSQKEINRSFSREMDQTFKNLDKKRVPDGILLDFGMEFTNVRAFNGTLTDSTFVYFNTLKRIYKTLLTSRVQNVSEGFVASKTFSQDWQKNRSAEYIALSGLYFKYAQFSKDAYPSKIKVNVKDSTFSDKYSNGVWQNPYQESEVFAIAPPLYVYKGLKMKVKLPKSIFYSNDRQGVQKIEVDFSDGQGFRDFPYDKLLDVKYGKLGTKIWKYKVTFANSHTMLAQSRIKIGEGLTLSPARECNGIYSVNLEADHAYLGQKGKIKLTIDRAQNHCSITKPLIVAEGFDVGTLLNPENSNGMSNINSFKQSIQFSYSTDLNNLLLGNSQDYDIIYVDWENGVDYMQRNAYALEKAIEYVNNEKTTSIPNVVLGQSMGGVIARYALADMENRGVDHDTRLFISDDAPQQGANVPLGFQYLYRHLTNQYVEASSTLFGGTILVPLLEDEFGVSTYLSILDAPASRQLLKEWSDLDYDVDNNVHEDFYSEMQNLNSNNGYPQDSGLRMVAISNGSECGSM